MALPADAHGDMLRIRHGARFLSHDPPQGLRQSDPMVQVQIDNQFIGWRKFEQ